MKTQINNASIRLREVMEQTLLQENKRLAERYDTKSVLLKREDLSTVRSFKLRGAYNKMATLTKKEQKSGIVCASAGNHAQGVALACTKLKIKGTIFMPTCTPVQKINRVKKFSNGSASIHLEGDTYDDSAQAAKLYAKKHNATFVHAFDDILTIAGQGTVGKEIIEQTDRHIDMIIVPVGGGGLLAGIASYVKATNPNVAIIGAEPEGAASMHSSLKKGKVSTLANIDTFADGVAVKKVGKTSFELVKKYVDKVVKIPEGKIAKSMIELYQNEGIVTEPAGAISIASLSELRQEIKGKNVVCVISGGNNDVLRYTEILERSLIYQGLKHYFIVEFSQRPGQLKQFLNKALGPNDDIVRFEYIKKTNLEHGPALVGIELKNKSNYESLTKRMNEIGIKYQEITPDDLLYRYIV